MVTISIGKADVVCPDKVTLTSGMVKAVLVAFQFSEEWDGFNKVAVFSNGMTTIDVSIDDVDRCYIPHEILAIPGKDVTCGVYGSMGSGESLVVIPTVKCSLGKVVDGVDPSGDESVTPTNPILPDIYAQIGDIDTALDSIIVIQESFMPSAILPGEEEVAS